MTRSNLNKTYKGERAGEREIEFLSSPRQVFEKNKKKRDRLNLAAAAKIFKRMKKEKRKKKREIRFIFNETCISSIFPIDT